MVGDNLSLFIRTDILSDLPLLVEYGSRRDNIKAGTFLTV